MNVAPCTSDLCPPVVPLGARPFVPLYLRTLLQFISHWDDSALKASQVNLGNPVPHYVPHYGFRIWKGSKSTWSTTSPIPSPIP